ncbi:sensor histidine kinase [Aliiruegeria sabulilitoris]|uniref:sensor histidine kinase n=1 Tax=Aliiruegeria sabulilitoris TaxID=1510458 RepID=UPI0008334730|nr:ATP-binding protein [Aliiruegeria sabulilitoris]NDR55248.1 sensor histidine kinase [Pseudoruegeria sp. M32A2M]
MRRIWAILAYLAVVAGFTGGVWWFSLSSDLEALAERGEADLSVASDRLVGQLQRFRELAVLLSDHPDLEALLNGRGNAQTASELLRETADKTGSLEILAVAPGGQVLATSEEAWKPLSTAPYLKRAIEDGALGAYHSVEPNSGLRVSTFAAPVFSLSGPVAGAVVVRANIGAIEAEWRGDAMTVAFTDSNGVILSSNRSELLFRTRTLPLPAAAGGRYGGAPLAPFPEVREIVISGYELWRLDAGRYVPGASIHLTRPLPVIGMQGEALVDIAPAVTLAGWQALVTATLGLVIGAFILSLLDRRQRLSVQLSAEAAANARLEQRVRERTAALSAANKALRREVDERIAAEQALKRAQGELIQAGKLSALGQMSAGISHELNQPLMAISSFAENGTAFLERGKPERAAENLGRISEMARRMGRIIRNLRAFARQEVQPVRPVDLGAVVEAVLLLSEGRIKRERVVLDWQPPAAQVIVRGGEVRLQQVVMNLVSNALDAMEGRDDKRLGVSIELGDRVRLCVSDTGCGIASSDRIFDPFYTTKEVGRSEGMGLGLSISYGIVQSFGGAIRGTNRPEGGAVFTVELEPAEMEAVA